MNEKEPSFREKMKHLFLTGETMANEKRKAEMQTKIDTADKTYRIVLAFFFLIFWVVAIWKIFA